MDVKHIGSKLRDLRRSKNTTQAELALALKTSQQQIARWEAGISPISFSRLIEILQVFEVSLSEIDYSLLKPLQEYLKESFEMNKKYKDMVDAVDSFLSNDGESQTTVETDKVMVL